MDASHIMALSGNYTFNCAGVQSLPLHGAEILALGTLFLTIIVMCASTFIDVAAKQLVPKKLLDPVVYQRVQQIQDDFPLLKKAQQATEGDDSEKSPLVVAGTTFDPVQKESTTDADGVPLYDRVVCQAPYIATRAVDEDLIYILANNDAFSTVSSYCSSTVRGYAMLSTMLLTTGMCISFLWTHNMMIFRQTGDLLTARYVTVLGYCCCFFTGVIMCGSDTSAVWRDTNIALWSNVRNGSKLRKLHGAGIVMFCLLPMLSHCYRMYEEKTAMPNFHATLYGVIAQVVGLVCFLGPNLLVKAKKLTQLQGKQYMIIGEIIAVFSSMLTFVQVEIYATAMCAGAETYWTKAMFGAMIGPLVVLLKKHYTRAPTKFVNPPSLLLCNGSTPVAVSGPVPDMGFDMQDLQLPVVKPHTRQTDAAPKE